MENVSTALIIVASILIAVLIASLIVYVFSVISAFAQKQVNAENVSEVLQFNQPFLELEAKASHDFSGRSRQIEVGATAEDVLTIINHTNHLNKTSAYPVDFNIVLKGKTFKSENFTAEKQQEFIEEDLKARESVLDGERLKYSCILGYNEDDVAARVNYVMVKIIGR